jgi:hypothetical protein
MSNRLWTPPHARTPARAGIPDGDVRLGDGRTLFFCGPYHPYAGVGGAWDQDARHVAAYRDGVTVARRRDRLRVLATLDETPHGGLLHVSLSYDNRLPDWATVKAVREAFVPDTVDVMMVLPRSADYVNAHEYTFHLWQTPVGWGLR